MKRLIILLLAISMLLTVVACVENRTSPEGENGGQPDDTAQTSDTGAQSGVPAGFVEYHNAAEGFTIHYPPGWHLFDETFSEEDIELMMDEAQGLGLSGVMDDLGIDFNSVLVYWFDFNNATDAFIPNINLTLADSSGMTQEDLGQQTYITMLQEFFESMYATIFEEFTVIENLTGAIHGGNQYAVFKFGVNLGGVDASFCQAITIVDGEMYTFTLTTRSDLFGATVPLFENMLASLTF